MSYALLRLSYEKIVRKYSTLPRSFEVPVKRWGFTRWKRVKSPAELGDEWGGHRLVEVVRDNTRPGAYFTANGTTSVLSGNTLAITTVWEPWTQAEIDAYEAAQTGQQEADLANEKLYKALFRLAKGPHRPDLTPAQFKNWMENL